jgi:pimeloyl-ACP methyl ester carboxylesterase
MRYLLVLIPSILLAQQAAPTLKTSADDIAAIRSKVEKIEAAVRAARAKHADEDLIADVDVYAKAGKWVLEFPEDLFVADDVKHTLAVLDTGAERAAALEAGHPTWTEKKGKRVHGYYSPLDGSVQPYAVNIPDSYDGTKPTRLYVWMHGRSNKNPEYQFLYSEPNQGPSKPPVADNGQITLDLYGRWNGSAYHYAGEADVFEALAAVERRYKIDDKRIVLRGFSMGGAGAWNIALHNPDRWVAAEIGAGTWSNRAATPGLPAYQLATLRIWENMEQWGLNVFNLPLAGHDGDHDTQVPSLPPPPPGTPNRGQLESSLRTKAQLVKEGFELEGDPDFQRVKGTPAIFLLSRDTGHGTSPLVRERLDAFLKEWGDRGETSPDHIRFLTYTTRYNRDYWVSLDELAQHYERAEIDAQRSDGGRRYVITTRNLTRLTLRETDHARDLQIDGQHIAAKSSPEITLEKSGGKWAIARGREAGLHKTHALQGPIDDAFLDPFILVRPTGQPWSDAVNQQALRMLARFDHLYAKWFRAHPRIIDDKDLTAADIAKYHVVLFGDPGSNRWIAKVSGTLPVKWTHDSITLGDKRYAAGENFPALIYPNPLNPRRYIVINTAMTFEERGYRGDYGMPMLGDYSLLKVNGTDTPDVVTAGLFDEQWRMAR